MRNNHKHGPSALSPEAREFFRQTVAMYNINDPPSLILLTNAAKALDRLRAAEHTVRKEGATFRDRFNQLKANPACSRIDSENATIARCLRELGLDLSAAPISSRIPEV